MARLFITSREQQLIADLTKEFMKDLEQMLVYWSYSDYDDFYSKYGADVNPDDHGKFDSLLQYYQGIGLLVRRGSIDPELVYKLMRFSIIAFWEKYKTIVEVDRERYNTPKLFDDIEYLYDLMKKHRTEELDN